MRRIVSAGLKVSPLQDDRDCCSSDKTPERRADVEKSDSGERDDKREQSAQAEPFTKSGVKAPRQNFQDSKPGQELNQR